MAINVGSKAPDFTLLDTEGQPKSLSDYSGRNVVVAFFPAVFSGACDNEMCTFRDSLKEYNDLGTEVIGISVDQRFANKEFAAKHNLGFPILSDYRRQATKAYDVLREDFAGMEGADTADRAVFVIDKSGTVRYAWQVEGSPANMPPFDEVQNAV